MGNVINLNLLKHPINWLIVWTVFMFAGYAWALVAARDDTIPTDET